MILRAATGADAPAIAELFLASRRAALPYLPELHTDAETHDWVASHLLATHEVAVAEVDGRVAGFAALEAGVLGHLYVHPGHQGTGIGSELLAWAKTRRPDGLELWTFQRNEAARRFYERRGFREVELTDGSRNEEREPDVRYAWAPARDPILVRDENDAVSVEREKQLAAEAAAELVVDGMIVGLGTGSTVAELLRALSRRRLSIRCVATSPATEAAAGALGIAVEPFDAVDRLDIAIDGADQIAPDGWLVKGGGAAHTREKIVASAADRFVVIADSRKAVEALGPPVPLELLEYGLQATLLALQPAELRNVPRSPDGGVIADYLGPVDDPAELAARLSATPGVVEHGLFPPALVTEILIGRGESVERIGLSPAR